MEVDIIQPIVDIDHHKIKNLPLTAFYVPNFVTSAEEQAIINNIYSAPKPKWTQLANRRLQNWGGLPHVKGMVPEPIPRWLLPSMARIESLHLLQKQPNHVLINEYLPGQGIMPHFDGALFSPTIVTVSLGSHIVLKFYKENTEEYKMSKTHVFSLLLEPRSLLVLQDELYTEYLHGIEEVTEDVLDDDILNLEMCSDRYVRGSTVSRETRISLTIRNVPNVIKVKLKIGN